MIQYEPANGAIVGWFLGQHLARVFTRIDAFANGDPRNWYQADDSGDFEPMTWPDLCEFMQTYHGPVLLVPDRDTQGRRTA